MAFGISGFGAQQTAAAPQLFQALSVGGRVPAPPAPPYGTPNQNLVPVGTGKTFPPNLTLAAEPAYAAVLQAQSAFSLAHPPIQLRPLTTAAVAATNPGVTYQQQGPAPPGLAGQGSLPQAPVSFIVPSTIGLTSSAGTLASSLASLRSSILNPPASAVATIAKTVAHLAVSAVYPQSIFSFHA